MTNEMQEFYSFDSSGRYTGKGRRKKVKGLGLPANSTELAPPVISENEEAVFSEEKGWSLQKIPTLPTTCKAETQRRSGLEANN